MITTSSSASVHTSLGRCRSACRGVWCFPQRRKPRLHQRSRLPLLLLRIVSLLNKGDSLSSQLAILNAKLDTLIELQRITLQSNPAVSRQIEQLSLELDHALINLTFRENLAEMIWLIQNINTVTIISMPKSMYIQTPNFRKFKKPTWTTSVGAQFANLRILPPTFNHLPLIPTEA